MQQLIKEMYYIIYNITYLDGIFRTENTIAKIKNSVEVALVSLVCHK
jgi:hypothetical protein